jgi:hypothetical protein
MGFPIDFHDQAAFVTGQVSEEGANRMLTSECEACEAAVAHFFPENRLGWGHFAPEYARPLASARIT